MTTLKSRLVAAACAVSLAGSILAAAPAHAAEQVDITLLGINDFHGRIDQNTVKFAGTIEQLREEAGDDSTLVLSAGDDIGASLFASSSQQDQPTIDVLNALELDATAVGNHEFDRGFDDLADRVVPATDRPILGANVLLEDGSPALQAYEVVDVDGLSVGVVGAVSQETPTLVDPSGIEGLQFTDPVEAVNEAVEELQELPEAPDVIVAAYHEGAPEGSASLEDALADSEVFRSMVEDTSGDVDALFMGHTHQEYAHEAPKPGGGTRPVVQTGSYGENIGKVELAVDPDSGDVSAHTQSNVPRVETDDAELVDAFPRVKEVKDIVEEAIAVADEIGKEPVGEITADITTAFAGGERDDRSSESTLGNLVAEATYAQVSELPAGADLAVVNPGGLRDDLLFEGAGGDGVVTLAEANAVMPFANNLSSVTLSGELLKDVFEQQWQRDAGGQVPSRPYLQLGTSDNVRYTFDPSRPEGERITSLTVDGEPVSANESYRVAVPSFLAAGGDNFHAFPEGEATDTGIIDFEAWVEYLSENSPISPDFGRHAVQVDGLEDSYDAGDDVAFELPLLDLTSLGSPANESVTLTLVQGEQESPLGEAAVSDGAASPSVTLPDDASGESVIRVEAEPSGTVAELPITIEETATAATVTALTLPFVPQGFPLPVLVQVDGDGATPTGTVQVLDGDTELGSTELWRGHGIALVGTGDLEAGRHTLTVRYGGDDDYGPAETEVALRVVKGLF
ncbi:5'-nucleotidase C-terminal domain-containing protein [Aeromicrobium sp. CTD01-1L150]|uniref:5'-nucleotidase C-terminal domain-containing protein n=1 Tax=Aeromicrobium sp. CTD01-1L150 TaxID=3341830 RepID=UPI0035C23D8E